MNRLSMITGVRQINRYCQASGRAWTNTPSITSSTGTPLSSNSRHDGIRNIPSCCRIAACPPTKLQSSQSIAASCCARSYLVLTHLMISRSTRAKTRDRQVDDFGRIVARADRFGQTDQSILKVETPEIFSSQGRRGARPNPSRNSLVILKAIYLNLQGYRQHRLVQPLGIPAQAYRSRLGRRERGPRWRKCELRKLSCLTEIKEDAHTSPLKHRVRAPSAQ